MSDKLLARLADLHAITPARRRRRGMTLMEVMIVIAIILLVMGTLTYGVMSLFAQGQGSAAELQIMRINERVQIYRVKKRKLPTSLEDIFRDEPPPLDPWGNEYMWKSGGKDGYDIVSLGADGKEGGTGSNADIKLSEIGQ